MSQNLRMVGVALAPVFFVLLTVYVIKPAERAVGRLNDGWLKRLLLRRIGE